MQKLTSSDVEKATVNFYIAQQDKKKIDSEYNKKKSEYYAIMNQAFESGMFGDEVSSVEFDETIETDDGVKSFMFRSTRIIPTTIVWDVEALKKKLPKDVAKKVIKRNRNLFDIAGLAAYVKQIGGDPKVFWSFFDTEEYVDNDEMNQASDLGEIEDSDIIGCYSVTTKSESYRVTSREVVDVDEDEVD